MTSTARPGWWAVGADHVVDPVEAWDKDGAPLTLNGSYGLSEVVDYDVVEQSRRAIWVLHDATSYPASLEEANYTISSLQMVAGFLIYYEMDPWGRDLTQVLHGIQKHRDALERWKKKREPEEAVEALAKQEPLGS